MEHPSTEVQTAIVRLCDALCSWERSTGRESVLILREVGGYEFRAASGKTNVPADLPDDLLMATVRS